MHPKAAIYRSGYDTVRCVAALLVVGVHCNTAFYEKTGERWFDFDWILSLTFASVARICVPLFFILSGALLLKPHLVPGEFFRKRIQRIVPPLVVWSLVYWGVRVIFLGDRISFVSAGRLLYNAEMFYHLWFLYSLMAVYAAFPFLSPLVDGQRQNLLTAFAVLAFAFGSIFPFLDHLLTRFTGHRFHFGIPDGIFWVYVGYAVAGALLRDIVLSGQGRWACLLCALASMIATILLSLDESAATGKPSGFWMGYTQCFVSTAALSTYLLLMSWEAGPRSVALVKRVSDCSFGIYLIHPLLLVAFGRLGWPGASLFATGFPVLFLTVFTGSAILVVLLRRFRLFRLVL